MMTKRMMILNLGSTSFKFKYFFMGQTEELQAEGSFENIGKSQSAYQISLKEEGVRGSCFCKKHGDAFRFALNILIEKKVLGAMAELDAVGYKAVHAGTIHGVRAVNDALITVMERYSTFAPSHNPAYIRMMKQIRKEYPDLLQLAHFETTFHADIPLKRVVYGVPYEWVEKYGIRKYGFHGASHNDIADRMKKIEPQANKVISVHLGGSSSICAIADGKSIASTMGATPQSGLFHNNRVGDFDVFCLPALIEETEGDIEPVLDMLSTQGGFFGLSGVSNDLREILAAMGKGDRRAILAVEAFVDNIVGYIGMFSAFLKGIDAIVFTGGIGYKSQIIRSLVCCEFAYLGLELDEEKNKMGGEGKVSSKASSVSVYALETNEERIVARKCYGYLMD